MKSKDFKITKEAVKFYEEYYHCDLGESNSFVMSEVESLDCLQRFSDQQNAKLVEENEVLKDDNYEQTIAYKEKIESLKSELTQAKERIEGLEKEIVDDEELVIKHFNVINKKYNDFNDAKAMNKNSYIKAKEHALISISLNKKINHSLKMRTETLLMANEMYEKNKNIITALESKCKGLEEKQIGFAEWLMEKGYLPLLRKITKEKVRFRIDELYAIYSQTLLNG